MNLSPAADSQASAVPDDPQSLGAAIYASSCSSCHDSGRPPPFGGLDFRLSSAVNAPNPQNIVNVTLFGLPAADGQASAVMPDFAAVLDDQKLAALLNYMRTTFTDKPAWTGLPELINRTRTGEHKVTIRPTDGIERAPEHVGAEG
jgi:mono/diheme cytochrome c family protein